MTVNKMFGVPDGYVIGLIREPKAEERYVSHLYKGTHDDPGAPMCRRGWNRGNGSYSIWRGNVGLGVCKVCLKRALEGRPPVDHEWQSLPPAASPDEEETED